MKIRLERTLPTCPSQLRCIACNQSFKAEKIRSLLYDRTGLLQGDLCCTCRSATDLQQKLYATEKISRPKFYEWWFKQVVILSEVNDALRSLIISSVKIGRTKKICPSLLSTTVTACSSGIGTDIKWSVAFGSAMSCDRKSGS
jgi:hypothetical protein